MTLLEYYHTQCSNGAIIPDPQQLIVLQSLQKIYDDLIHEHQQRTKIFSFFRNPRLVSGLYLHGGVGIGKTFLMDCLYECLPFSEKTRMHFHQFMQLVHQQLIRYQGEKNPLDVIAKEWAKNTLILCFDEFIVSDITDAMILAGLFNALFSRGVCLITTSNTVPDDLYKNGMQREQFLPTISLIKQNTTVMELPTVTDYRLRHLRQIGVFYTPNDAIALKRMEECFTLLAKDKPVCYDPLLIHGRTIHIKKRVDNIVWFDFNIICAVPRNQHDYLSIAENFSTIFISNIPIILAEEKNTISLFIRLIDVLYNARIRLVFSAAGSIEEIYSQGTMLADYARTRSRLMEMQSEGYFLN